MMITQPDWNNAPEGAEEFSPETGTLNACYFRENRSYYILDPRKFPADEWDRFLTSPSGRTFIKRPPEDTGLNREEAIQWCIDNPGELPEGWGFLDGEWPLVNSFHDLIHESDVTLRHEDKPYWDGVEPIRKGHVVMRDNITFTVELVGKGFVAGMHDGEIFCPHLDQLKPPKPLKSKGQLLAEQFSLEILSSHMPVHPDVIKFAEWMVKNDH